MKKIQICCFKGRVSLILSDMLFQNNLHANQDPKLLFFYAQPGAGKIKEAPKVFEKFGKFDQSLLKGREDPDKKNVIRCRNHSD